MRCCGCRLGRYCRSCVRGSVMGAKSERKRRFLAQHPFCCFCGGFTPAAEPDHVPSRVFFESRQWPEGFEFPACVSCNRVTRHDEQIVAMLSWIYPDQVTEKGKAEVEERIRAVAHNYPAVIEEMRPTVRQLRNAVKKYDLKIDAGQSVADFPVLAVNGPLVNAAIENFSRKLFCALYYKHSGRILPASGGIAVRWFSNVQVEGDEIPRSIAPVLLGFPKLERSRVNLDSQFFYRWGIADTNNAAAFLTFFRRSFAIVGYVNADAADFKLPDHARIVRPYVGT
jgi:hypothetical protein